MEDAHEMTRIILDAVRICRVRAIVSEGWSKLGAGVEDYKDVLFIGDCPHGTQFPLSFSFQRLTFDRMALQARFSGYPPWRSRDDSLRPPQRPTNSHCSLFRRVSVPSLLTKPQN